MKGHVKAVGEVHGRPAAALIKGGRLEDLLVDPPVHTPRMDALYWAIATRPVPGLGGQFLALPGGQSAFLRGGALEQGKGALVQVRAYAEPGKAVPVTQRPRLKGRFAVVTFDDQPINFSKAIAPDRRAALAEAIQASFGELSGVILRSAAANAPPKETVGELRDLLVQRNAAQDVKFSKPTEVSKGPSAEQLSEQLWPEAPSHPFDTFEVQDMVADILTPEVSFTHGSAFIEPTRAFVAVDVNAGGDMKTNGGLQSNIALARDLPRLLRCRGLGGQIVIDAAPMPKRHRDQVEKMLLSALRDDPVPTDIVGWTGLGHLELKRAMTRYPLHL